MTPVLRFVALAVLALLAQRLLGGHVRVLGVVPDLLVLLPIVAAVVGGATMGGIVAFVVGALADVSLPTPLGLTALAWVPVAYLVGALVSGPDLPRVQQAAFGALGSAVATMAFVALATLLGDVRTSPVHVLHVVAVVSLIDGLLAPALVRLSRPAGRSGWSW